MQRLLVALTIAVVLCPCANAQIQWLLWDPVAIAPDRSEPARLEMQLDAGGRVPGGNAPAARIDLAAGGSLTLTPLGSGRFTAMIAPAQLLYDYKSDDINRNFVGYIRLLDASNAVITSYNAFISVVDTNIPRAGIMTRDSGARQTARILNLYRPLIKTTDVLSAVQQFYTYFADDFDFVQVIFTLPTYPGNRSHMPIRNDVSGIGMDLYNNAPQYGSAGRLLGINSFPIDTFFDAGEAAFSHETGHQWINYVHHPKLMPGPHWPMSSMATGVMGLNIPGGGVGGEFNVVIEPLGNGSYRVRAVAGRTKEYSDFDLYLMGLLPASQVSPGVVLEGALCTECTLAGSAITVQDIIAMHGQRLPDASTSRRSFRVGTVVVSRDRLLNDDEMALLEYFAARGEARAPLPYSQGLAKGTTNPFYLATRGLATVDLRLTPTPRRRAVRR